MSRVRCFILYYNRTWRDPGIYLVPGGGSDLPAAPGQGGFSFSSRLCENKIFGVLTYVGAHNWFSNLSIQAWAPPCPRDLQGQSFHPKDQCVLRDALDAMAEPGSCGEAGLIMILFPFGSFFETQDPCKDRRSNPKAAGLVDIKTYFKRSVFTP